MQRVLVHPEMGSFAETDVMALDLRIDRITNIAVVLFSPFSFIFSFLF